MYQQNSILTFQSELVSFQKKHAALQEFIRVQAGMLQGLHAHMLMEQRAFEDTQVSHC